MGYSISLAWPHVGCASASPRWTHSQNGKLLTDVNSNFFCGGNLLEDAQGITNCQSIRFCENSMVLVTRRLFSHLAEETNNNSNKRHSLAFTKFNMKRFFVIYYITSVAPNAGYFSTSPTIPRGLVQTTSSGVSLRRGDRYFPCHFCPLLLALRDVAYSV